MEPNHKYICHLSADPPQDAPLQCDAELWVDVWARDFDHARSRLGAWLKQMGMSEEHWRIVAIEQSNDKE